METLLTIASVAALFIALVAWFRARGQSQRIEDLEAELRRSTRTVSDETEEKLTMMRKLLALVATGRTVTADMIEEGRVWQDMLPEPGRALVESGAAFVLDVRTAQETSGGMLPGAVHIPISELEERFRELPKDSRPKLIYCAGGSRSAAACEFLAQEGFEELINLAGGISSWTGPIQR